MSLTASDLARSAAVKLALGLRREMLPLGPRYGIDRDLRGAENPSLFFYISFLWGEGAYSRDVCIWQRWYIACARKRRQGPAGKENARARGESCEKA